MPELPDIPGTPGPDPGPHQLEGEGRNHRVKDSEKNKTKEAAMVQFVKTYQGKRLKFKSSLKSLG